jgi:endo-beta-N-acetylglucosaminidase D
LAYTIPSAAESDTVTIGFAFQAATISGTVDHVVNLYSDTNATFHFDLTLANTGALTAARAANGLQTSATGRITTGTWQYIEVQVKLHDSAGQAIVRVGGAEVINFTGDTKNGGTKSVFDTVRLPVANTTSSIVHLFDDLYITTGAGAPFKGDITVP